MVIKIYLEIILFGLLFFLSKKIDVYLIFIFSIVIHEMSHFLVGKIMGFKTQKMELNPLGMSIKFYSYGSKKVWKKILIYIAGPCTNFLIASLFFCLNLESDLKEKIIYTNILLGIFNLLPLNVLDGGKILKEFLLEKFDIKKANIISVKMSKIILILLTLTYSVVIMKIKNITLFILILYLWYFQYVEEQKAELLTKTYNAIRNIEPEFIKN